MKEEERTRQGLLDELLRLRQRVAELEASDRRYRELEEGLKQRVGQLESMNVELKAFNYSVSHDLRTPLLVIAGFSRKLLERCSNQLDPREKQFLDIIHKNTQNMLQLIDDLLAFCNLENQKLKSSEINMSELARDVFEGLRNLNPRRTLILGTLPRIRGDRAMIRQVFFNLLSNACKFTRMKANGTIEIGSIRDENKIAFYVKDNGIGFDMKDSHRLFNAFQRLQNSDEFEGSGVGLAIVKRIIDRHGGWVWAEGRVNEGATFYFGLPLVRMKTV